LVSVPVDDDPLVTFAPDHAPDAAQLVALVLVHVNVELEPLVTDEGLAANVTTGVGTALGVATGLKPVVDGPSASF
jgi:hypothetical protein